MQEGKRTHPAPPDFGPDPYGYGGEAPDRGTGKRAAILAGTGLAGTGYLYGRGISFPDTLVKGHEEGLRRLVRQRGFWGNIKAGARETPKDVGRLFRAAHQGLSTSVFNKINKMATKQDRLVELNSKLERIINFADDDDRHLLRNTALLGGAGLAGAGGLYAKGAMQAGVKPSNLLGNLVSNVRNKGLAPVGSRIMTGGRSTYGLIKKSLAGLVRE